MSNINSVATVTWEDFLAPMPRFRSMKEKNQLPMIKIVGIIVSNQIILTNGFRSNALVIREIAYLISIERDMLDRSRVMFRALISMRQTGTDDLIHS